MSFNGCFSLWSSWSALLSLLGYGVVQESGAISQKDAWRCLAMTRLTVMCFKVVLPIPRLCIMRTRFWDEAEE